MVGRFVEQHDVGTFEQYARQSHASLLTAREFFHRGVEQVVRKGKAFEHAFDIVIEFPSSMRFDFCLQLLLLVAQLFRLDGVGMRHFFAQQLVGMDPHPTRFE